LIFDEIQSGFFVTGKVWAHQYFNLPLPPDIVTFSKKAQMGGMYTSKEYFVSERGILDSTWGGAEAGLVRAVAYLQIIRKQKLIKRINELGIYALDRLKIIEDEFPDLNLNARGLGLVLAIDFPNTKFRDQVVDKAWRRGLIVNSASTRTIRILPRFDTKTYTIDDAFRILEKAISDVEKDQAMLGHQTKVLLKVPTDSARNAQSPGGIDLNGVNMKMGIQKDGQGPVFRFDPAMIGRIKTEGFDGLEFNIQSIVPVTDLPVLLGIGSVSPHLQVLN